MKILDFQIENIGVHKSTKLDLTKVPSDLVMINGYNNYGKTTLLDSLRFCLFDREITPDLLSNSAEKSDLKVSASMPITVRVKLELADKSIAIIERKQFFTKQEDGLFVPSNPESVLTVNLIPPASSSGDVDFKTDDEAERWLATQLPPKFMNFILFNGEEMQEFLKPQLRKTVEEVVVQSARLEHFNDVRNLIIGHREELQKQAKKILRSSGGDSQDDIQTLQDNLDELEAKQSEDNGKLDDLKTRSEELEKVLIDSEEGKELVEQHKNLVDEIKISKDQVKELEDGLRQQTWVAGVNTFFELRLKESLAKEVSEAQINGMYPARFAKDALESIIREGQCICGTRVHGDKDAINHIQDLISLHDQAGPIGQGLQAVEASLQRVIGKAGEARRTHRTMTARLNRESGKLEKLDKQLKTLLRENPELDSETSSTKAGATAEFKDVTSRIETLSNAMTIRANEIAALETQLDGAKVAQSASLEREGKSKDLVKSLNFIDRVIAQSKGFSDLVLTGVREEITLYINEKFSSTVGGNYKTVVNPDFSVVCLNDDGTEAKISKGQEMLRAYFFAFALRKVAGMQFPLIVDSPKGRLDGRNSETVIESIAELVRGEAESQMLFFMIDDECTPDVRENFLELGATEYHLKFQEKPFRRSTIEVGMDPEWILHGVWKVWAENQALKERVGNA